MIISNRDYNVLEPNDLFVCTLGYEPRSYYLLNSNIETRNSSNTIVLKLDNGEQTQKIVTLLDKKHISIFDCKYQDSMKVKQHIVDFYMEKFKKRESISLFIDYSSMPRSWYCALPVFLSEFINDDDKLVFLYTAGDYPYKYENYPTAGIDSISVFSGITLPTVDIRRYHIMGLGYDKIRTETVKSIIEPDILISCYAYNSENSTKENVVRLNGAIIKGSLFSVALPVDNFSGMVDKLCELTYAQLRDGQVIIVPDGPKPLIMAMSLIPSIIRRNGVTCLHISRNNTIHNEIPVTPRENEVFGFQVV